MHAIAVQTNMPTQLTPVITDLQELVQSPGGTFDATPESQMSTPDE